MQNFLNGITWKFLNQLCKKKKEGVNEITKIEKNTLSNTGLWRFP